MANFRNLRVWRAAEDLVVETHRVTALMRGTGSVTLRDQLTRATMSVPANIVEGSAHTSPREFVRYLRYAIASVSEAEGHLQLAHDLGMITDQDFAAVLRHVIDVRKMLHGLLKSLLKTGTHSTHQVTGNR